MRPFLLTSTPGGITTFEATRVYCEQNRVLCEQMAAIASKGIFPASKLSQNTNKSYCVFYCALLKPQFSLGFPNTVTKGVTTASKVKGFGCTYGHRDCFVRA